MGPDHVALLNEAGVVAAARDWNDASRSRLWIYNLHYFDDLTARDFRLRRAWHEALVTRWIEENPPGQGAGWEPYPTSLRMANWIKWALASAPMSSAPAAGRSESLAIQARWLGTRLEVHLLGNHLWANAKALVMAGLFFDGPEADHWRRRGLAILDAELGEQFLPDGGHFERSPMYHAILLEDVLDLVQLSGVFPGVLTATFVDRLRSLAIRMLRWLRVMSHPDGQVSFFNDAAFRIAAPYAALADYAGQLAIAVDRTPLQVVEALPDSGYVRLETPRAAVLCDVAPVGPDHQPAHAHADTLSFELSVDGRRVIVNGGTSTYATGAERDRQRGTAAHSTVEVDGVNSSDVWAGFRVARRARPFDVRSGVSADHLWVEGAHDGYRHRPGKVIHRRMWSLDADGLTVTDRLEGSFVQAVARFMFHPDVAPIEEEVVHVRCSPAVAVVRVPTAWHPEFGRTVPTRTLEVTLAGAETATRFSWS